MAYVIAVAVHVAPDSPAAVRIRPVTDVLLKPWFTQRWTLFAPDPPDSNLTLYAQARVRTNGKTLETQPIRTTEMFDEHFHGHPLAPSRAGRVPYTYGTTLARTAGLEAQVAAKSGVKPGARLPAKLRRQFAKNRARFEPALTRFLSRVLREGRRPGAPGTITGVRALLVRTPVTRFSERGKARTSKIVPPLPAATSARSLADVDPDHQPVLVFDTGWLAYVEDVA